MVYLKFFFSVYCTEGLEGTTHSFDVWHGAKNIGKKLSEVSPIALCFICQHDYFFSFDLKIMYLKHILLLPVFSSGSKKGKEQATHAMD